MHCTLNTAHHNIWTYTLLSKRCCIEICTIASWLTSLCLQRWLLMNSHNQGLSFIRLLLAILNLLFVSTSLYYVFIKNLPKAINRVKIVWHKNDENIVINSAVVVLFWSLFYYTTSAEMALNINFFSYFR